MDQDQRHEQNLTGLLASVYERTVADLRADRLLLPFLHEPWPVHVIAIGKASLAMTRAVQKRCSIASGIVVSPDNVEIPGLKVLRGGHPLPDGHSIEAGHQLAAFAQKLPAGSRVLGLLSGGASALAELPGEGWTLESIRAETERLMSSGADITALNAFRRETSQLKGGGLGRMLSHTNASIYVLSDVYGSDFSIIGSGPFWTGSDDIPHVLIGDAAAACARATNHLAAVGFTVRECPWISGEARLEGAAFAQSALNLQPGEALVAMGEPVVTVRGRGTGGRAQEFALAASQLIAKRADLAILGAGTDGRDGATDAAGAIATGWNWDDHAADDLSRSNSYEWARRTNAILPRRATETNVNDLFVAVCGRRSLASL